MSQGALSCRTRLDQRRVVLVLLARDALQESISLLAYLLQFCLNPSSTLSLVLTLQKIKPMSNKGRTVEM